jgi:hypothetical protein
MISDERKQQGQEMGQELSNWLRDLWDLHFEDISNVADASGGKTALNFAIEVDLTGTQPHLRGTLEFKQVKKYSDSRERVFGEPDPEQNKFEFASGDPNDIAAEADPNAATFVQFSSERLEATAEPTAEATNATAAEAAAEAAAEPAAAPESDGAEPPKKKRGRKKKSEAVAV